MNVRTDPVLRYVFADQIDTPRLLSDANGRTVWSWEGEGFGRVQPNENPDGDAQVLTYNLRFPGQLYDKESGLYYNWHRYYDPATGRYVSSDPIGLEGGVNTYAYVNGNPLTNTDPNGLNPLAAAGAEGGFVVGGPIGAVVGGVIGFGAGLYIGSQIMESRGKSDPVVLPPVNPGRDCDGKCLPCPKGAKWWVPKPGHGHTEGYWHTIVYNQDPRTCMCYPDRPSQGLQGK